MRSPRFVQQPVRNLQPARLSQRLPVKRARSQRVRRPLKPVRSNWSRWLNFIVLVISLVVVFQLVRSYWTIRWLQYPFATDFEALSYAIAHQESHGNFQAVNPDSGALGYAQVMPENLPEWSQEALGYEVSPAAFLADPQLQQQIVEHRLALYWQQALEDSQGDKEKAVLMVASRWYSGDSVLYNETEPQFYNGEEYPSIASYSERVLRKWQLQRQPWRLLSSY